MKNLIIIWIICFIAINLTGQQEIILTKYSFNELFFNPAYAGSSGKDQGSVSLQYRNQWFGVEGAPQTVLAAGEYSFFNNKLGLGLTIGQESIGINRNTEASLNTAYRIQLGEGFLSGGIRTGFSYINSDFTKLNIKDQGDVYNGNFEKLTLLSVGAGLYYHQDVMKIGFSLPNIVSISNGTITKRRHIYGHMEVKIGDEYSSIIWQPNLLVKYEKSVPLQLTLGIQAWLMKRFAPGIHYRVGESVALSFEMAINNKFSLTSAYDYTANDLRDYSSGSIELMLTYKFEK